MRNNILDTGSVYAQKVDEYYSELTEEWDEAERKAAEIEDYEEAARILGYTQEGICEIIFEELTDAEYEEIEVAHEKKSTARRLLGLEPRPIAKVFTCEEVAEILGKDINELNDMFLEAVRDNLIEYFYTK